MQVKSATDHPQQCQRRDHKPQKWHPFCPVKFMTTRTLRLEQTFTYLLPNFGDVGSTIAYQHINEYIYVSSFMLSNFCIIMICYHICQYMMLMVLKFLLGFLMCNYDMCWRIWPASKWKPNYELFIASCSGVTEVQNIKHLRQGKCQNTIAHTKDDRK